MSHHHNEFFDKTNEEANKKLMEAFKKVKSPEESEEIQSKPGATGNFPDGKLIEKDDGEIAVAFAVYQGRLIMNFGKPVAWIGFTRKEVENMITLLTAKLNEL